MATSTTVSDALAAPIQSRKGKWLKQVRQLHLYLGTLFAPAILFFAFTGALQLFGLHEGHPGETYQPPSWIAKLASIHKKQTLAERRGPSRHFDREGNPGQAPKAADATAPRGEREPGNSKTTLLLKWFFLAASLGLVITTLLGVYRAFKYNRSRALVWGLLVAGTVIPAALIGLMT